MAIVLLVAVTVTSACTEETGRAADAAVSSDGQLQTDRGPRIDGQPRTAAHWAVSADVPSAYSACMGAGIAVDAAGSSTITGSMHGTATFGATTLTVEGLPDIFIARLDPEGRFLWALTAGGKGYDGGEAIATDAAGDLYVTGAFSGTATFGSTTLTSKGSEDLFVAKLDSSGTFLWAISAGGAERVSGTGIAVDATGKIYVSGSFSGQTAFGSTTLTSGGGAADVFVAKLDSSGLFLWATAATGSSDNMGGRIALDSAGNSHVAGYISHTTTFGTITLEAPGNKDAFVAKLDGSGTFVWADATGRAGGDTGGGVAVDSAGEVLTTGDVDLSAEKPTLFVAKHDKGGALLWNQEIGSASGAAVAVDGAGNGHLTGHLVDTASFGSTSLTSSGTLDLLVAKLDPGGTFLWATSAGGAGEDLGSDIAVDGAGNIYVVGGFHGQATFGSTTLLTRGQGSVNVFVAKLDPEGRL